MSGDPSDGLTRRGLLLAAGAILLAPAARTAGATVPPVPEVDGVAIEVLVDNATFGPFLDPIDGPGLRVTRAGGGPPHAARLPARALEGEFGLSLLAISHRGAQVRRVLVDFGYSPEVAANNLRLLGVDPATIDAAVLSHGHLDHYGGFPAFARAGGAPRLPLTVGGEETFCERVALVGDPPPIMGRLDRDALARAGFDVRIRAEPEIVADQALTSGTIPLVGFERAAIPTQMRPGVGCARAALDPAKRDRDQLPDDGEHELATCYAVRGLGLVVIASCSHRGVINSIRRAQAVSGIAKVHAVVGGFHLVKPRTPEEARRTAAELAGIDPAYIVPMHCTGEDFIAEALRLMPQKVIRSYVGSTFTFGTGLPA